MHAYFRFWGTAFKKRTQFGYSSVTGIKRVTFAALHCLRCLKQVSDLGSGNPAPNSVTIAISGGTRKRTGRFDRPSPLDTTIWRFRSCIWP